MQNLNKGWREHWVTECESNPEVTKNDLSLHQKIDQRKGDLTGEQRGRCFGGIRRDNDDLISRTKASSGNTRPEPERKDGGQIGQ